MRYRVTYNIITDERHTMRCGFIEIRYITITLYYYGAFKIQYNMKHNSITILTHVGIGTF